MRVCLCVIEVLRTTRRFGSTLCKTNARLCLRIPGGSRQAKGLRVRAAIWAAWGLLGEAGCGANHDKKRCENGLLHMCLQTVPTRSPKQADLRAGLFFCAHTLHLVNERIGAAFGHAKLFAQPLEVRFFAMV